MRFSSGFCREQEAVHLARAESEPLANRRAIALAAAKAWAGEALVADQQAARQQLFDQRNAAIAANIAAAEAGNETARITANTPDHPTWPDRPGMIASPK